GARFPHARSPIGRSGDDPFTVGRKLRRENLASVLQWRPNAPSCSGIPGLCGVIGGGCDNQARVRAKASGANRPLMAEFLQHPSVFAIPKPSSIVFGSREDSMSVGAELYRGNLVAVPQRSDGQTEVALAKRRDNALGYQAVRRCLAQNLRQGSQR